MPAEQFRAIGEWSSQQPRHRCLPGTSVYQHNAENPYEGTDLFLFRPSSTPPLESLLPQGLTVEKLKQHVRLEIYPTRAPLDALFETMLARRDELAPVVGAAEESWAGAVGRVYAYPAGSKVIWHEDKGPYTGAYIYYTHAEWHPNWGGQLLYRDSAASLRNGALADGHFVAPAPNRLVLIRSGTPHTIANVSQAAGENTRNSIAGFFVKSDADAVEKLIATELHANALRAG